MKHYDSRLIWARIALATYQGLVERPETKPAAAPLRTVQVFDAPEAPEPDAGEWSEEGLAPFEVQAIQKHLRALGYYEVGKVDGSWGSRTTAALCAFQQDSGLTVDGHYGPATRAALAQGKPRPVSEARASTTLTDVRNSGSSIIRETDHAKGGVVVAGGAAVAEGLHQGLANYSTTAALFSPIQAALGWVPSWVWVLLIIGAGGYAYWRTTRAQMARVNAERVGLHAGEPDPAPSPPVTEAPDGPEAEDRLDASQPMFGLGGR